MISNANIIPEGWKIASLYQLGNIITGNTPNKSELDNFGGNIPFIKPPELKNSPINSWTETLTEKGAKKARVLKKDSVLVSCIGNLGKTGINSIPVAFNQQINAIVFDDNILPKYGFYYFQSARFREQLEAVASATTIAIVNKSKFESLKLIFPSLEEQHLIVEKIEELLSELEKGVESFQIALNQLKTYRRAVLKSSFEGSLIKSTEKWSNVKLGDICNKIFDGPFGSHLKTSDYTETGVRVVRLENIGFLNFINEKQTFISQEKYQTLTKHTVSEGDLIFASFVSEEVRTAIIPKLSTTAIAKADCFCVRPNTDMVSVKLLSYFLSSTQVYNQLVSQVHGATRPRINTTQLKNIILPLPRSIELQNKIVSEIEARFSEIDNMEKSIKESLIKAEALRQSILKKAFEGKLVSDELLDVVVDSPKTAMLSHSTKTKPSSYQLPLSF